MIDGGSGGTLIFQFSVPSFVYVYFVHFIVCLFFVFFPCSVNNYNTALPFYHLLSHLSFALLFHNHFIVLKKYETTTSMSPFYPRSYASLLCNSVASLCIYTGIEVLKTR